MSRHFLHAAEWAAAAWAAFVLIPALILDDGHPRGVFIATLLGIWGVTGLIDRHQARRTAISQ